MQSLVSILPYVQIVLAVLMTTGILLQQRGAGLGGAFGADSGFGYNTRRGAEKILFNATMVFALLFVTTSIVILIIK